MVSVMVVEIHSPVSSWQLLAHSVYLCRILPVPSGKRRSLLSLAFGVPSENRASYKALGPSWRLEMSQAAGVWNKRFWCWLLVECLLTLESLWPPLQFPHDCTCSLVEHEGEQKCIRIQEPRESCRHVRFGWVTHTLLCPMLPSAPLPLVYACIV